MTLFRQLLIAICGLITMLFAGLMLIGISNVRDYLDVQLKSISDDTAVTLALRLSPHLSQKEEQAIESIVNVVFDSGYYKEISLRDTAGQAYLQRNAPVKVPAVPSWFIAAVPLVAPQGTALIADGWRQMGSITVTASPGYAYLALWNVSIDLLLWFGGAMLVAWGATFFVLRRIMRPLQVVELQAAGIAYRQYHMQPTLPWTREIRTVVVAMNKMVAKVRELFEVQDAQKAEIDRLWSDCYTDKLTGLANRRYFDICLQKTVDASQRAGSGALVFIELGNLHEVNESGGYTSGDEFLQRAAKLITALCGEHGARNACIARLSGGNFAILMGDIAEPAAADISARLKLALGQEPMIAKDGQGVHVGFAVYRGQSMSEYIGEASWSLCYAQIASATKDRRITPATHPLNLHPERDA